MNNKTPAEETNVEDISYHRAQRAGGGSSFGGSFKGDNWLKKMEEGTIFIARRKSSKATDNSWLLTEYLVYNNKPDHGTWLIMTQANERLPLWVLSDDFSNKNERIETLKVIKIMEPNHGESPGVVSDAGGASSSLADDEEHEEVSSGEEGTGGATPPEDDGERTPDA